MAGTGETMGGTIVRLLLIQGTAFGMAVLGLKGGYRSRPRLTLIASAVLFLMTLPLIIGRAGLITLVCAVCFLLSYLFSLRKYNRSAVCRLLHKKEHDT